MTLYDMRQKWPTATREQRVKAGLHRSLDDVERSIAEAETSSEASNIADALAPIAAELNRLVTKARERADRLLPVC